MDEIIRNCFNSKTVIDLKTYRLEIDSLIAEGGFGYVFKVHDVKNNKNYALKRLSAADQQAHDEIRNEIDILQLLQPHKHIMGFVNWDKLLDNVYILLCEHCDKGCLTDLKMPLTNCNQIYRIIYQTSLAIGHMHKHGIIHRDIKAENILFDSNGLVRLCDFGSATKQKHDPSLDWSRLQRSTVEEEMQRHTTPMYRPPEILETYLHYPIGCSMDVWALGCLIYYVRFGQHAFPDSGKLAIVNCRYNMPKTSSDGVCSIINQCLQADPRERITIESLIESLELENLTALDGPVVPESECVANVMPIKVSTPAPVNSPINNATIVSDPIVSKEPVLSKKSVEPTQAITEEPQLAVLDGLVSLSDTQVINKGEGEPAKSPTTYVDKLAQLLGSTPLISDTPSFTQTSSLQLSTANFDLLSGLEDEVKDDNIPTPLSPEKVSPTVSCTIDRNSQQKSTRDMFDDLLPNFKRSSTFNDNKAPIGLRPNSSLEDCLGFDADPMLIKIEAWKESRSGNIRALLSSLHTILTDDFKWRPIDMHQLILEKDVKKVYRDACLLLHPDKVHNEQARETAKVIFVTLSEAWKKFENK